MVGEAKGKNLKRIGNFGRDSGPPELPGGLLEFCNFAEVEHSVFCFCFIQLNLLIIAVMTFI